MDKGMTEEILPTKADLFEPGETVEAWHPGKLLVMVGMASPPMCLRFETNPGRP